MNFTGTDTSPFSPFIAFSWLWFILTIGVLIYPLGRILNRIGFSPLWAILAFIPLVNLIALWALALADWPERRA